MKSLRTRLIAATGWAALALFAFSTRATAQGNNINGLTQQVAALQAQMTDAEQRLSATETRLTTAETRLTSAESRLSSSEARLLSAEGRLSAAETVVSTLTTQSATQAAQIAALQAGVLPVGTIITYSAEVPPPGYLECDGSEVSRAAYPNLFAAIGTAFGHGDGVSTFRLPQTRGLFMRGWDHGNGFDPDRASRAAVFAGGASGDHVGSFQDFMVQAHSHGVPSSAPNPFGPIVGIVGANAVGFLGDNTFSFGGAETRPRNLSVMYAIKY